MPFLIKLIFSTGISSDRVRYYTSCRLLVLDSYFMPFFNSVDFLKKLQGVKRNILFSPLLAGV